MAELIPFSRQDIERLAEKLNELLERLEDGERRLLLAILEVAAENAYQTVPTPDAIEGKELRARITRSFVRDDESEFAMYVRCPTKIGDPTLCPP